MALKHAKLSASGAHRWINCPGSVALEEDFPDSSSAYAKEGTLAHDLAELKLKKEFVKGYGPKTYEKDLEPLKASEFWARDMDHYTDLYKDEVKRVFLSYKHRPFVAIEQRVDFSPWVPEGFGTCDCILISGNQLAVIDLKYGKGVPVSPENNPQLMLYGLGAYNGFSSIYKIDKISLCIVQPRLNSISWWDISKDDLLAFGEEIKPIAQEAFEGSSTFKEGDHCRFCRAKSLCMERAKTMFKSIEELKEAKDKGKDLLSLDEVGDLLKKSEGVTGWIKDLEALALDSILAGDKVPGYRVVEGRSNRKITNPEALASQLIIAGFDEAMIYKPKQLETITNLEKLTGKKEFAEIGKGYIEKPQGKPTLVKEDDKREDYKKDLSKMFNEIN